MYLLRIFFFSFLERTLNFRGSQKNEGQKATISEVIDSKGCAYLNA